MRKNDLIKLLQEIKGNPEVAIWNGFVEDWQPISKEVVPYKMVKYSGEYYKRFLKYSYKMDGEVLEQAVKEAMENSEWEQENPYFSQEQASSLYGRQKTVFLLCPKARNKSTWDRLGDINY